VVKAAGFATLLMAMAGISLFTLAAIALLPRAPQRAAPVDGTVSAAATPPRSSRAAD
jgi:hypothetical protein